MINKKYNIKTKIRTSVLLVFLMLMSTLQLSAQRFDNSTTYTVPAGTTSIKVHAWGGGGGGGTRSTNGATGGGGGGAYSYREISVTQGQVLNIVVGSGGSAGNAGGDTRVYIGANNQANDVIRAKGGSGVANNMTTGGAGGEASQGIGTGTNGGNGSNSSGNTAGNGGNSPNGGSGGVGTSTNANGVAGTAPGGGGAGARRSNGTQNGGTGGAGRVLIEKEYEYWGSGSRDLYPNGTYGGRATLRASESSATFFPFPNYGTHYVYAEAGETIAIGTSAQGYNNSTAQRIYLTSPTNVDVTPSRDNSSVGRIDDRYSELEGPRFSPGTTSDGNKYRALYYTVPPGGSGIYKVEFRSTGTSDADNSPTDLKGDDDWNQGSNTIFIYAWDISVANAANNAWIPGRVYTNVFMSIMSNVNGSNWRGDPYNFYGKFIVHTRDGFMYEVDNNGNAGYRSSFMVNNKGFHTIGDATIPSYQSIAASSAAAVTDRYRDPRGPDGNDTYTQKIFYSLPDINMPASSIGAVPNGRTWLHVRQPELDISTADFVGADGESDWTAGNKGGFFVFEAQEGLMYEIKISPSPGAAFVEKTLIGYIKEEDIDANGKARVYWDGKDGDGNPLPNGVSPGGVTLQLQGAEVHFPYIDMEVNPNGIKLQLYNPARNGFVSDKVYWDDTAIGNGGGDTGGAPDPRNASHTVFPDGTPSTGANANGHKWGSSTGPSNGTTFGNNQGMDTWTFAKGSTYSTIFNVTIKEADLEVTELSASKSGLFVGDEITYTVRVKNNGNPEYDFTVNNAPFHFVVPKGFEPATGVFYTFGGNSCGVESGGHNLSFDAATNTFKSELNLPKGCEITYTIKVKVKGNAIAGDGGVRAGILRPSDVYDPDGTNISDATNPLGDINGPYDFNNYFYPPFDPFIEAKNNGQVSSNNVKDTPATVIIPNAKDDINQTPFRTPVGGSLLTNDKNLDKVVELSFNGSTVPLDTETSLISGGVNYGTIRVQEDGSYTFKPAPSFHGKVPPVNYTAENIVGGVRDDANLYITVTGPYSEGTNNPPIAQDDVYTTVEGVEFTSNVLSNDSDPDGNNLTVTTIAQGSTTIPVGTSATVSGVDVLGNPVANAGTVTINSDGKITFDPEDGFTGDIDPINYVIVDGQGGSDNANVYINVVPNNGENKTFANDDANAAPKGETMAGNVLENDFDPEGDNQVLSSATVISAAGAPLGINLTLGTSYSISGVGELTMNTNGSYTFVPHPDFVGTVVINQNVCDNGTPQACDDATLYLTNIDIDKGQSLLITNPMIRQRVKK